MNTCRSLLSAFSASTEIITWFFNFVHMVKYLNQCLNVKSNLHFLNKPYSVMTNYLFYIMLNFNLLIL